MIKYTPGKGANSPQRLFYWLIAITAILVVAGALTWFADVPFFPSAAPLQRANLTASDGFQQSAPTEWIEPDPLSEVDAEPYKIQFEKLFLEDEVAKQLEPYFQFSLKGPTFYRNGIKRQVRGRLSIGFVGWYEVTFEDGHPAQIVDHCFRDSKQRRFTRFAKMEETGLDDFFKDNLGEE